MELGGIRGTGLENLNYRAQYLWKQDFVGLNLYCTTYFQEDLMGLYYRA